MTDQERTDLLDGATVRYAHFRFYEEAADSLLYSRHDAQKLALGAPLPRGGLTFARVEWPNGETVSSVSRCSTRENFCKAIGRQVALGRALKIANERRAGGVE